jgi:autotransporter-associated beta strand protein
MTTRNSTFSIPTSLRRFILAAPIAALLLGSTARAQYYWDSNSTTSGFGSTTGTWGASAFWSTSSAGTGATANSTITTADTVNFGTATNNYANGTVTGPATAQGFLNMIFGAGQTTALTLSGGTLNLASSSTITQNSGSTMTISSVLQGSGSALVKDGTGTLVLSGTNTYNGGTTVSTGALSFLNTNAKPASGTVTVASGATLGLGVSGANAFTSANVESLFAGTLSGVSNHATSNVGIDTTNGAFTYATSVASTTRGLTKLGANTTLTLSGTSSFTGAMFINEGTVSVSTLAASGIGAGSAISLGSGSGSAEATLLYTGSAGVTVDRTITINPGGAVNIRNNGSGALVFNGSFINSQTSNNRILVLRGSNTGANDFQSTIVNGSGGTLGLTKGDVGTWTVSGANTYTGATTISAGTLSAANIVVSGGSSNLGNATSAVILGSPGALGTLSYTGNSAIYTRGFTIGGAGGGRLDVTTAGQTLTVGTGNITGTGLFTVGGAGNTTITSNLTHTGGLTKADAGTLTLSGTNTYTGGSTVSNGTLVFRNTNAKATSGTHAFAAGTTLGLGVGTAGFFTTTDVTNAFAGTMTGNLSNVTVTATTHVGVDTTAGDFTYGDNITGSPTKGLTKLGVNTLTLSGANTYTGTTTVSGGALQVGNANTGTTGTGAVTVQSGGTILGTGVVRGTTFTAASGSTVHAGDGTAQSNYGTLTLTPASGSGSFDFQSGSSTILGINPGGTGDLLNFDGLSAGTLLFNGNLTVTASGYVPSSVDIFNLLDWTNLATTTFASRYSAGSYGGLLLGNGDDNLGFDLPDISGSGYGWDISQFTTNGTIMTALVPEPSRALLLLLGLTGLVTRRRRSLAASPAGTAD